MESENDKIQEYRNNNYYPETTELFDKAINQVIEIIQNSGVKVKNNSKIIESFLKQYKKYSKGNSIGLQDWYFNDVVRYSEVDPNAILFPFPVDQKGFIAKYDADNSIKGRPAVDVLLIPFNNIEILSEGHLKINMGGWVYEEKVTGDKKEYETKDFYLHVYPDQFDLEIPEKDGKMTMRAYYRNILGFIPMVPVGNRYLEMDGFTFFVSNFFGAANQANIYIAQKSDEQVISTKYFPVKYEIETECKEGCIANDIGVYCINGETCKSCGGSGVYKSTTMFGTVKFPAGDELKPGINAVESPIGWVSPDAAVYELSHRISTEENDKIAAALCVNNKQNMTNQSGESKMWDARQKQSMYSKIVNSKVDRYELLLRYIEMIIENKKDFTVEIIRPAVWDILTEADLINKLSENKKNNAPYSILLEDTKDLLIKKYGQSNKDLIDFVVKRDLLVVYGLDDLQKAKALFGAAITNKVVVLHTLIIQLLLEISVQNPDLDFKDFDKVNTLLEKELEKYYLPEVSPLV
ncbi:MAG: hypothetical protein ABFD07_19395 [Methanobacterium sp.]